MKCIELNNCELDDVSLKVLGLSLANGDCPATKITLLSNNFSLEGFYHFLVSMENARPLKSFDVWIELSNLDSEQYLNSKFPDSKRVHVEKISDVWQTLRVKVISENSAEKLFFSNGDFDEENTIPDYLRHIFNVEKSVDFKDASTVEEEEFYCIDPKEVMDVPSSHVADSRFLDQDNESIIMHSESEFYMDYIFV